MEAKNQNYVSFDLPSKENIENSSYNIERILHDEVSYGWTFPREDYKWDRAI